ncbi:ATP-binding cassette domain-containing protein [Desulfatitalea tepidiphila]|uniref:ATP-binding cassette domain-containing protein n=1 Tax=Desulfatitalea tepidiphila TaxID=1185843 RepID=UPI0006B50458|nr:ATP-binding cassette domain-containing protein [Desulfatitalea tepidiphila]
MNQPPKAVEVSALTKKFGALKAVDNISFEVPAGEIFGFLGPNGAGKTTLIRMLTPLLKPSSGLARVGCWDVLTQAAAVRREIGVVPQAMTSDLDLTAIENMDIYGRFYSIPAKERRKRIAVLLEKVGLTARAGNLVATYSGGMRRRLEIARVLVHHPKILFLDEPTIGLDPQSRRVVWQFVRDLQQEEGMTIFLTTHYMDEAESLCQRVAIIDAGRIIALGTVADLKAAIPGNDVIALAVENSSDILAQSITALPFVHKVAPEDGVIRVFVDSAARHLPALIETVLAAGGELASVSAHEQSLEDVFIHYTGKSIREEEARKVSRLIGAGLPQKLGR